ncbi:MAG TPA: DUF4124 domain-containing protein [Burkholderiales bacterium]|nr:DUF4124 domain-containing protein [Burkholderiales bacterium]
MKTLALLILLAALPAQAQMYKCVDARGKTEYTDKPLEGCKESAIKPSPPVSGAVRAPQEDFAKQEADLKQRQIERETSAAKERDQRAALAARCVSLRSELGMMQNTGRIFTRNAQGEREPMDDTLREQRIAKLQQELRACP